MLRNRIPRRGRHAPPFSVVRGIVIDTYIAGEDYDGDRILSRTYATEITSGDGDVDNILHLMLRREDDDRRAWEQHWFIRNEVRRRRWRKQ